MSSSKDPLSLAELDPDVIQAKIDAKSGKITNELEQQKEARLAEREKRLAGGKATAPPPKAPSHAPPPAPPPPTKDRSMLLDKLTAYRERFPELKKRNNVNAKSTVEEIEDELHYIELQLGSHRSGNSIGATALYASMVALERATERWNPLGLNLTGLSTVTQQNMDQFQPIIDELMIKYSAGMYTSPEWRLAITIGATVMTVNAANQNPDLSQAMQSMNKAVQPPPGSDKL